jgi:hypothetical protein
MCFSWSVFIFSFSFLLFCFLQLMVGSHHVFWERDKLCFHCQEHSSFHSFRSTSVLFF